MILCVFHIVLFCSVESKVWNKSHPKNLPNSIRYPRVNFHPNKCKKGGTIQLKAVMKRNLVNIDRHSLFVDILVEFVCNHPPLLMICCLMLLRKAVQHQRSSMTPLPGSVTCPKHSNICHHTKIKKNKKYKRQKYKHTNPWPWPWPWA